MLALLEDEEVGAAHPDNIVSGEAILFGLIRPTP